MANAVITKTGDIVETCSNDVNSHFSKIAQNVVTGFWVGQNDKEGTVDSNLQLVSKITYKFDTVDTIDGNSIPDIGKMYDNLKLLL